MNSERPVPSLDGVGSTAFEPRVDVLMIGYNVEPFIGQAVAGVLAQRSHFPVRLVIAEDCSTDGTQQICQQLAMKHPGRIHFIPGELNLGISGRTAAGLAHCQAEYVAICDSDDIWTDERKLADQVAFLDQHPGYGVSFTDVQIITREGQHLAEDAYDGVRSDYCDGSVFARLLKGNFINNSTAVVRRSLLVDHVIDTARDHIMHDHLMWMHVAARAKVHFLPRRTTAYRQGGVTSELRIQAANRLKYRAKLGAILLDHARQHQGIAPEDRPVILRKGMGVLFRSGTELRIKWGLLFELFNYLPTSVSGWRSVLFGKSADTEGSSALHPGTS